jgi:hypothetical protein
MTEVGHADVGADGECVVRLGFERPDFIIDFLGKKEIKAHL